MNKEKVGIILPSLKELGPVIVMNNIIRTIDKNKFEVILISLRKNLEEDLKRYNNIKILELKMGKFPTVNTKKKLSTLLKENDIKLIHVNSFWPTVLCSNIKINKIVTVHNNPNVDFTFEYGNVLGKLMARIFLSKIKRYDKIISISKYVDNVINENKTTVIYNSIENIDTVKYDQYKEIFKNADINLYTVSVLNKLKNVTRIVKIVNNLIKQGINAKCVIIGDGDQRKNIEKKIKENKLEENIIMLGKQNKEVIKYIATLADAFIFTSINEGFGLVLTEALRDKKRICCSNFETAYEILNEDTDSKICTTDKDFVTYISELATEKKLNNKKVLISEKNYNEYKRKYTNEIMTSKYMQLYEEISCSKKKIMYYIPFFGVGGIESLITNFVEKNNNKYQFTLIVEQELPLQIKDKLDELNVNIIKLPNFKKVNIFYYCEQVSKIFKYNECDIFHSHDYTMHFIPIMYACFFRIRKRILHIHSTSLEGNKLNKIKKILARLNILFATEVLACSEDANKYVNTEKSKVLINGIDSQRFKFNQSKRKEIRNFLKIKDNEVLLIQIGRLTEVKNYYFTLELIKKLNNNYKLVILGDGVLRGQISDYILKNKLNDKVFLLGNVENVYDYISASDIFMLPSLFEGMPITLLEAQASGINCIVSENITKQVDKFNLIKYLKLDIKVWYDEILNIKLNERRDSFCKLLKESEFDINNFNKELEKIYEE